MIEVESLTKHRGAKTVLDRVSLRGAEGGVTALVGPSGGGKSTLLRCLNGLESFEAGTIDIAGHRLVAGPHCGLPLDHLRRDVGMVFQQFNLFPHLSVLDNVMLAPRTVLKVTADEARS
ncbi:MAG: ATP-binding cassette domain-containing protein, partial [Planctomycetota bacterium]